MDVRDQKLRGEQRPPGLVHVPSNVREGELMGTIPISLLVLLDTAPMDRDILVRKPSVCPGLHLGESLRHSSFVVFADFRMSALPLNNASQPAWIDRELLSSVFFC